MEAVGGGLAVVSIAPQLIQTANTVTTCIRDYKNAPEACLSLADTLGDCKTF